METDVLSGHTFCPISPIWLAGKCYQIATIPVYYDESRDSNHTGFSPKSASHLAGVLFFRFFGVVVVERFIVVNSHSFENDPRGRRKTDHFCPVEERWDTFCQESGASTTFKCVPRTTPKIAILKPQVADSLFLEKQGYGQGSGDGRSRWARFVARRIPTPWICSLVAPFEGAFGEECPF